MKYCERGHIVLCDAFEEAAIADVRALSCCPVCVLLHPSTFLGRLCARGAKRCAPLSGGPW